MSELEFIAAYNLPIFLVGDFNYNLANKEGRSDVSSYVNAMESFFLDQHVSSYTHVTDKSATETSFVDEL